VSAVVPPLGLSNKATLDGQHQLSKPVFRCDHSHRCVPSSPHLDLGLAKTVRGRAAFHHVMARGRKSVRPRLRGGCVFESPMPLPPVVACQITSTMIFSPVHRHRGLLVSQAVRDGLQGHDCEARRSSDLRYGNVPAVRTAARRPHPHRDRHRVQSGRPVRPDRLSR
jgi:hypothetical protein